jgi:hypothetical protein
MGLLVGVALTLGGWAHAQRFRPSKPEVLVALAQLLDAEHQRVDLLLRRGDVAGAIAALESLRTTTWPTLEEGGDAAVQLRHDAWGRLLRLRLDHPEVDPQSLEELLAIADEGLRDADRVEDNPFTARLFALRGEMLALEAKDHEALADFERALEINRVLLDRELGR